MRMKLLLTACLATGFCSTISAQEPGMAFDGKASTAEFNTSMELAEFDKEQEQEQDEEAIEAAKEVYKTISESIAEGEWESASELMTEKTRDAFCVEVVMMALVVANTEFPPNIPGMSDFKDDIQDVIEDLGLDELDIDVDSVIQKGGGEDADPSDLKTISEENEKNIIAALDKDGERWKMVNSLWEVESESPFNANPLAGGEVTETELDGDACILTISAKSGGGGMRVMVPPTIIRIEKTDAGWKYAGRDAERTQAAMEKFMEGMQNGRGGPDF